MSGKRMGWFNMNGFTVVYDPPLGEFESYYKKSIEEGLESLCCINIYYKSK